ncbi:MAG: DUF4245 family protein [Micrococcales bacterium]
MAEQDAAAKRRARQTVINLSLALAATVLVALVMIMITPRDDSNLIKPVDYVAIAADVKSSTGIDVAIPSNLPADWWSNAARFNNSPKDGVKTWHVGFVGDKNQYIGIDEGFNTNPTWVAQQTRDYLALGEAKPIGREVGIQKFAGQTDKTKGLQLWVFTLGPVSPETAVQTRTVIISGTGSEKEFSLFADLLGFGLN